MKLLGSNEQPLTTMDLLVQQCPECKEFVIPGTASALQWERDGEYAIGTYQCGCGWMAQWRYKIEESKEHKSQESAT